MIFENLSIEERRRFVISNTDIEEAELRVLNEGGIDFKIAQDMVENVIGTYALPYSVVPDFLINNREYIIPMVGEEPYVVGSIHKGALLAKKNGGFKAINTGSFMVGQVQLMNVCNPKMVRFRILQEKDNIVKLANECDPILRSFGGGCKDIDVRLLDSIIGTMVVVNLIVNTVDAMGAQILNKMTEFVAPYIEKVSNSKANLKVISNHAIYRLVRACVHIKKDDIGGVANVDKFISAYAFADADQFRAATNNKGVMNGITPLIIATGNDTRAVESAIHSYASVSGRYKPITSWEKDENGDLCGCIEVPIVLGIVGGTSKKHPGAQLSLKMMKIESALELAQVTASVGLAANLGVLYSLVTVGLHEDFESMRNE